MKSFFLALILAPTLAIAAPAKKSAKSTDDENASILDNRTLAGAGDIGLRGLSIYGAYDFVDTLSLTNANVNSINTDKTFVLGAEYKFSQFTPGLALQAGGTYNFSRDIKGTNADGTTRKIGLTSWVPYVGVNANLTPKVSFFGMLNYSMPSLSNAQGITPKGKMGYEFGASYAANTKMAIDARYRSIEMNMVPDQGQDFGAKLQGLMIDGRYMF